MLFCFLMFEDTARTLYKERFVSLLRAESYEGAQVRRCRHLSVNSRNVLLWKLCHRRAAPRSFEKPAFACSGQADYERMFC